MLGIYLGVELLDHTTVRSTAGIQMFSFITTQPVLQRGCTNLHYLVANLAYTLPRLYSNV